MPILHIQSLQRLQNDVRSIELQNYLNQGNIYTFDQDEFVAAMETAESKADVVNEEGLKLQKEFTYEKTLNKILEVIQNDTP